MMNPDDDHPTTTADAQARTVSPDTPSPAAPAPAADAATPAPAQATGADDEALVEDLIADLSDEKLAEIFGGESLGKIEAALVQRL